jgi:hypothetical protein
MLLAAHSNSTIISTSIGEFAGKPRHTNGGPRMFAGLTEHFHHEIRKSVDHERLVSETFGRVDHAKHLDHALDPIE